MKTALSIYVVGLTVAAALLCSCSKSTQEAVSEKPQGVETKLIYNQPFFGRDLNLVVINAGKRAVCFSKVAIDPTSPYFELSQNGAVIPPQNEANREVVSFNGVDVAGGMEVVPPGRRNFYIDFSDFNVKQGQFSASIHFEVVDCAELFSSSPPSRQMLHATAIGKLPAR